MLPGSSHEVVSGSFVRSLEKSPPTLTSLRQRDDLQSNTSALWSGGYDANGSSVLLRDCTNLRRKMSAPYSLRMCAPVMPFHSPAFYLHLYCDNNSKDITSLFFLFFRVRTTSCFRRGCRGRSRAIGGTRRCHGSETSWSAQVPGRERSQQQVQRRRGDLLGSTARARK